jgi:seryl-tRNA synthetase
MLTLNVIRENKEKVIAGLKIKNFDASTIIDQVIELDKTRREIQQDSDALLAEMNNLSKEIGQLFKEGKQEEANTAKARTSELKEQIKDLTGKSAAVIEDLNKLIVQIPNLPSELVSPGTSAEHNTLIREGGAFPKLSGNAQAHWDLARKYDIIDFELGNKLTGAGFPVYKGKGARLQRALINFFLDQNVTAGYQEYLPPLMVNEDSGFGTGQLPDKEGQMYHVGIDNLYLIPTAEVPITNIFRDVILSESDFPVKCTAYTPCFRREAGSYGKDVRGLNRLHQFDKVEIVQIQKPENSYKALDEMVEHVEKIIQLLNLPYRILRLCGGDMSFTSALTYDFEVYSAAQKRWLEVSSVSNFETYQANRLKLRYKDTETKKTVLAHTLNGSSLALPRIVAALLENNQTDKGIRIPNILQEYTGFDLIS